MTAFLKASSDGSSMTWFGSEFQSLIVCARKLCLYFFVFAPTSINFLGWNCLVPCRFFCAMYVKHHCKSCNLPPFLEWWPFQNIKYIRNSSRSGAIFIFNKTCRSFLYTFNVLNLFLNVRIPSTTYILKLRSN